MKVLLQRLLHEDGERREALPHVGVSSYVGDHDIRFQCLRDDRDLRLIRPLPPTLYAIQNLDPQRPDKRMAQ